MSKIIAIVSTFSYDGMVNLNSYVEYETGRMTKYNENIKTHREYVNTRVYENCYLIQTKRFMFDIAHFRKENEMLYFENSNIMYGNNVNGFKTLVYTDDIVKYVKKHFIENDITDKFFEVYDTTETKTTATETTDTTATETADTTKTKMIVNSIYGISDKLTIVETVIAMLNKILEHDTFIECKNKKELVEYTLNKLGSWTFDIHNTEYHLNNIRIPFDNLYDIISYIDENLDLCTINVLGYSCKFYVKKETMQNYGFNFEENALITILKSYKNKSEELFDKIDVSHFNFSLIYYLTHAELIDEYFKYITLNELYVLSDSKQSENMYYKLYTDFLKKNLTNDEIIEKAMHLTYFNDMLGTIISNSIEEHFNEHGFIFDFDDFTETFTSIIDMSVNEFTHLCITIEEKTDIVDIFYSLLHQIAREYKLSTSQYNDTIIYYKYDKYLHKAVDILNTYANEVWE